jgi:uncharacterized membrane protein
LYGLIASSTEGHIILEWIEYASLAIEVLAVAIIVMAIAVSTVRFVVRSLVRAPGNLFRNYKISLGKALLLGLEILVAADVVRTVALDATIQAVVTLGLLVLIRTFLSWALVVEIEGRWPWQPGRVDGLD